MLPSRGPPMACAHSSACVPDGAVSASPSASASRRSEARCAWQVRIISNNEVNAHANYVEQAPAAQVCSRRLGECPVAMLSLVVSRPTQPGGHRSGSYPRPAERQTLPTPSTARPARRTTSDGA